MQVEKFRVSVGKEWNGQPTKNHLYAVVSRNKNKLLRVTMFKEQAEALTRNESLVIHECTLR